MRLVRDPPEIRSPPLMLRSLGAILAGGASRRFGAPKALAEVGGTRLIERVRAALEAAVEPVVVITSRPEILRAVDLPARPDLVPRGGPLAGIQVALRWAEELRLPGALCVACDMPFLSPALLREITRRGLAGGARAVVPESRARAGIEPLCSWYSTEALPEIELRLAQGEGTLARLVAGLPARRVPLAEVQLFGDPERLFLNVNTLSERQNAEGLAYTPNPGYAEP